jgi:PTH1 family peptidyl-tRNA hydrolase
VTRIETRDTWLVAGLGNPGPGYASHRHNVGQMALDVLAERIGARFTRHKTNTQLAEGRLGPGLAGLCS